MRNFISIFILLFLLDNSRIGCQNLTSVPNFVPGPKLRNANASNEIADMIRHSNSSANKNGTVESLLNKILQNYDKRVRPYANDGIALVINATIKNALMIKLDTSTQLFDVVIYHDQSWIDPRLAWNPKEYRNVTSVNVPANTIWRFWPTIYNSKDIEEIVDENYIEAIISYNGNIRVIHPQFVSCTCRIDMANFPYDTQLCPVSIEVSYLTVNDLDINILQPNPNGYFLGTIEFDVSNITVFYDRTTDNGATYDYVFQIERRPSYYIGVIVVPTFLTMALSILGIFAPGTSAEEDVNKGLATFFALTVLLSIVADSLPKSDTLPLLGKKCFATKNSLGIYVIVNIMVCVLTVLIAIFIGWLKNKIIGTGKKPPNILCRIFFVPCEKKSDKNGMKKIESNKTIESSPSNNYVTFNGSDCFCELNLMTPTENNNMNELGNFKSSLRSLIQVHKENLEKIRKGEPVSERVHIWELIFDRVDLLLLVIFEMLIIANLIYFVSFSWQPVPDMLKTYAKIYYANFLCTSGSLLAAVDSVNNTSLCQK